MPERVIPQKRPAAAPIPTCRPAKRERVGPIESPGPTINLRPVTSTGLFLCSKPLDYTHEETKKAPDVPGLQVSNREST
jgi:hypothetical protein